MSSTYRAFALLLVLVVYASVAASITNINIPENKPLTARTSFTPSQTVLVVINETINIAKAFDDDDFQFTVLNETTPIAGATVKLQNFTDFTIIDSKETDGLGRAIFQNVPQARYIWNVSLETAIGPFNPLTFKMGVMTSDGPEVFLEPDIGNLDHENDDDDYNATIVDIEGDPAAGLNFSIQFSDNNTIWEQTILGANGIANYTDIPPENYTWKITIMSGDYIGEVIAQGDFESNGTQKMLYQKIGPIARDPEYYDLEIFVYYEGTIDAISGVLVNVTYRNGTVIETKITTENGTVMVYDLPIAFINWTITLDSIPIGLGQYSQNLTAPEADIRAPIIISPGDQEYLLGSENVTITWHLEDEYPNQIQVWIEGNETDTISWTNTTYDYELNITGYDLGAYEILIIATDSNDNTANDTVMFRVYENVTPVIEGPDDVAFLFTETGYSLRWNFTDDHLDKYIVTRNDTEITSGIADQDFPFVTVSLEDLATGRHVFMIAVNDTSGNTATDEVIVDVLRDETLPVFTYIPPSFSYAQGDRNIIKNWTATDDFKDTYTIEIDGFVIVEEDWLSENIEFNFEGLAQGEHLVVLTVYDLGGNSASASVQVTVTMPTSIAYLLIAVAAISAIIVVSAVIWHLRYR